MHARIELTVYWLRVTDVSPFAFALLLSCSVIPLPLVRPPLVHSRFCACMMMNRRVPNSSSSLGSSAKPTDAHRQHVEIAVEHRMHSCSIEPPLWSQTAICILTLVVLPVLLSIIPQCR